MTQVIVNALAVLVAIYMVIVMGVVVVMFKYNKTNILMRAYQDMVSRRFTWLYLATALVVGMMGLYYPSVYVYGLISIIAVGLVFEVVFMHLMRKRIDTMVAERIKSGNVSYSDQKIW